MANSKLSALTQATSVLDTDDFYINQSNTSKRIKSTTLLSYIESTMNIDLVPFTSITGTIAAGNVGDAIREVQNELLALNADTLAFTSNTGGLVSTTIGDALRELQDDINNLDAYSIAFSSVTGGIVATTVGDAIREIQDSIVPLFTGQTYTVSNVTPTRTLDASTATATDVANVLGTLIQDLQTAGILS